jgi:hypothetical protein
MIDQELETEVRKAEAAIKQILQDFHQATGLIPSDVDIECMDVTTVQDKSIGRKSVLVNASLVTKAAVSHYV